METYLSRQKVRAHSGALGYSKIKKGFKWPFVLRKAGKLWLGWVHQKGNCFVFRDFE